MLPALCIKDIAEVAVESGTKPKSKEFTVAMEKFEKLMGDNKLEKGLNENKDVSIDKSKAKDTFDKLMGDDKPKKNDVKTKEADGGHSSNVKDINASLETRALTNKETQHSSDVLGWSEKQLAKCTIDENGVIHYKTDREDLVGKTSDNGVPYMRKIVAISGIKIDGVFPKFNSVYDTFLSPDNLKTKAYAKECNENLKEAITKNSELRGKFTTEQIGDMEAGRTPTGYVWHHNEEPGKMQLVKREDHDRVIGGAAHTGGNSLWGADSIDNSTKGERF